MTQNAQAATRLDPRPTRRTRPETVAGLCCRAVTVEAASLAYLYVPLALVETGGALAPWKVLPR